MKEKIAEIIRDVLEKDKNVVFAYFFGSFVKSEDYGDIDIGIYLTSVPDNIFIVTSELKHKISRTLNKKSFPVIADKIDVLVLNSVSFTFLNRVFTEGKLILDHNAELRTNLIEENSIKFRECLGLLREAGTI